MRVLSGFSRLPLWCAFSVAWLSLGLACLVGASAIWILAAELMHPAPDYQSVSANIDSDIGAARQRWRADLAARIGLVRGDLWLEDASTYGAPYTSDPHPTRDKNTTAIIEHGLKS